MQPFSSIKTIHRKHPSIAMGTTNIVTLNALKSLLYVRSVMDFISIENGLNRFNFLIENNSLLEKQKEVKFILLLVSIKLMF